MPTKTLEERLEDLAGLEVADRVGGLETMVKRLARGKRKKFAGVLYPFPLSSCAVPDDCGVVFRAIFPADGSLVRAVVFVEGLNSESPPTLEAAIQIEEDIYSRSIVVRRAPTVMDLEIPVMLGSRLTIGVSAGEVSGMVWTGVLFVPMVSDARVRKIVMGE